MKFHITTLSLLSSSFFLTSTSNLFCTSTSVAASALTALRGVGDVADADVDVVLAEEKLGIFLVAETEYEDGHDSQTQTLNIMIDDIIYEYELDDVEVDLDLEISKGLKSGQAIIIPPGVALEASSGKAKLNGAKIEPDENGDGEQEQEEDHSFSGRDLGEQLPDGYIIITTIDPWEINDQTQTGEQISSTNSPTQNPTLSPITYERNGPQSASYDASFGTPKCSFGSSCDSEGLLDGRGEIRDGNEPNHPNTLNNYTCTDGNNGSYHNDESIDKIVVSQPAGILDDMTEGDTVTITATVWCYSNGNGDTDYIDFYYASDASNPAWNQIGERQHCPGGGEQTLTASYTLPEGATQAVRVNMMYGNDIASEESCGCVTNEFADTDDLIISVMLKPTNSPSLLPSSAPSDQPTTSTAPTSLPSYSPTEAPSTTSMPSNWPSLQPSPSPSLSPSSSPSKAPVLTKTLVCGLGSFFPCFREGGLETTAAIDTKHEVRCCRDCEGINCSAPWQSKCRIYDSNLFALSEYDGVCMTGTFEEAVDFCRHIPGDNTRLCTPDELKNGCTKNTGCGFDDDLIWSCAYDGHVCSSDEECCGTCNASGICEGATTATPSSMPSYYPTGAPSITSMPSTNPTNPSSSSPSTSIELSSSPSLSPSTKPMKTLVCGKGASRRPCPEGLETTAAIDTKHEVRCCRDCEGLACSKPWKSKCRIYDSNLFALSEDDGVCMTGTFEEAVDFCRLIPGDNTRLCTPDELKNGCAKSTGCNFNNDLIWSCAYDGHVCSTDEECCGTCNASGICEGEGFY